MDKEMKAPPAQLGAADRNRVLSLQAALDLLNEVQVDLRIVACVHQAKAGVEDAIARILDDGKCLDCGQSPSRCTCD